MWTVDAFTKEPFSGNPAAVCLLEDDIPDSTKQALAAEMNLSETCFLTHSPGETFQDSDTFTLRWFTPTKEVPLCGHGTLASATVLFRCAGNTHPSLTFHTLSGDLMAKRDGDRVVLNLPVNSPKPVEEGQFAALVEAATCGLPIQEVMLCNTTKKLLVRLEDGLARAQLEAIRPNTARFPGLESSGRVAGVILTLRARLEDKEDFYSRYFAPWVGIPEDPVTGSAHTVLAPYWTGPLDKKEMVARQVSPRGGDLYLSLGPTRLEVAGEAVIVMEGKVLI